MKILVSHIYNEEYLLPWWLNHHKKYFDHGIIIDYASTDNSLAIVRELCPTWEIVQSRNSDFGALQIDPEVEEYESRYESGVWKIALNTTEFLIGKMSLLDGISTEPMQYLIPCLYFVDDDPERSSVDPQKPLWEQLYHGIGIDESMYIRRSRSLHNHDVKYPVGRHFDTYNTNEFIIFNYGYSPMTPEMYDRKLQIQNRIPQSDKQSGMGAGHTYHGQGLTKERLLEFYKGYIDKSVDLSGVMNYYLELMYG